jgi:hypothetical protein
MVLKRILSCLAMISLVFLMSCYDVDYDKDKKDSSTEKWWDGLSNQQIFELQEIKGNMSDVVSSKDVSSDVVEKEIQVEWEWPIDVDEPEWELLAMMDNANGTTDGPEAFYLLLQKQQKK